VRLEVGLGVLGVGVEVDVGQQQSATAPQTPPAEATSTTVVAGSHAIGEEPGKQAAVERAQRLGQAGLALLDAANG